MFIKDFLQKWVGSAQNVGEKPERAELGNEDVEASSVHPESPPMKLEEGRLAVTKVTEVTANQNGYMKITALLMAGGKGTRLKIGVEKPMLKLYGKPLIEYVLNALIGAKEVSDIVVTVSMYTRKTREYIKRYPVTIVETSGEDWHLDMKYTVKKLRLDKVLIVPADTPFLTNRIIDDILRKYKKSGKPALMVATPLETCKRLGLSIDFIIERGNEMLVPAGINIVDGRRIDDGVMEEEILIIDDERVAVNINTLQDLAVARKLYKQFVKI